MRRREDLRRRLGRQDRHTDLRPGETTKTSTIEVKGDSKREATETFYLDLPGLSSHALFTKKRGIGTSLNDDFAGDPGGVLAVPLAAAGVEPRRSSC